MFAERARSHLLVIDVQEKLAPHVAEQDAVVANCTRLVRYARCLGVPVTMTEHYPKGLGPTVASLVEAAGNEALRLEKITFSAWKDTAIRARIEGLARDGRDRVVVAGMEAHVCVGQTALDLLGPMGAVFLVADAVGSRQTLARDLAIERLRDAGAIIVSQEMIAFEWLERGDAAEAKDIIALVK